MSQIKDSSNAINILIQAVVKAQSTGAFTLSEASVLNDAIMFLTTPKEQKPSEQEIDKTDS